MNTLSFVTPAMLWGMLLAAIPIIIHLLLRRRFRRVDWAPMHYLKLSIQRNRRRIRLEQLLLLMLRTLLVLLLFFLVARPKMHAEGLGRWLSGGSGTSQVLLLDDSLSTAYRDGGRTAWERAREQAREVIRAVGPKDRFTLVLASQPKEPLLREVEITNPDEIDELIAKLEPADVLVTWEPVLAAVDELMNTGAYPIRELTMITDLRRSGWDETIAPLGGRWAAQKLAMRIFDVGSDRTGNVSLEDLRPVDRLALVGNPMRWEAVVHNASDRELSAWTATFAVDDRPKSLELPTLQPGETAQVELLALFQEAGPHRVSLTLPDDDLPGDNRRWGVCEVQNQVSVLLVDGEPSSEPLAGEVDFLSRALALGAGEADAFNVQVVTDSEWATLPSGQPDLVVLANVANVAPEQAARLRRQVEGGTGLMIFVGDQVDPANYNQLLYADGHGLLPATLESMVDEEVSGLIMEPGAPGPLDELLKLHAAVRERIKANRFYQVKLPGEEDPAVRVLAGWNSAESAPAIVSKTFGRGQVLLWTVTADRQWTDWPTDPSYVLAVREAALAIARSDNRLRNLTAGEPIRRSLSVGQEAGSPTVESPAAEKPKALRVEAQGAAAGDAEKGLSKSGVQTLVCDDTRRAGFYKLSWQVAAGSPRSEVYAVNPDIRESRLERIRADELRVLWGGFQPEIIAAASAGDEPVAVRGREIWKVLALCMLGLLGVESCFATWTGRQR